MDKYIGYEIMVRVTFPADNVEINEFLDEINATGASIVKDVVILASERVGMDFIRDINKETK